MDVLIFAAFVAGIYFCLMFFDSFFKSCMHYPYQAFLQGTGLQVRPFRLHWHTTAFNRVVVKWASKYPRLLNASFDAGIWTALLLFPLTLAAYFGWTFFVQSTNGGDGGGGGGGGAGAAPDIRLELMLPGISLPLDELGYYIAALAVCTVLHELGHAAAAVLHDVPVTSFGCHLVVVLPMAYTELNTDRLHALRLRHKLRVLCAGIWHNVLLALFAWAALAALGAALQPWFRTGAGVYVTRLTPGSPLRGARGLAAGDTVVAINGCRVAGLETWRECLVRAHRQPPAYCVTGDFIRTHDESVPVAFAGAGGWPAGKSPPVTCCDPASTRNVCFEWAQSDDALLADGDNGNTGNDDDDGLAEIPQHMCLQARRTLEESRGWCDGAGGNQCVDSFCVRPLLANGTTILQLRRHHPLNAAAAAVAAAANSNDPSRRPQQHDVMYIGHPADISRTIGVSEYVPRTAWLSPAWADGLARMLRYLVVFSAGLAFVNVLPCYAFDGQHIVAALIVGGLVRWVPERGRRELLAFAVTGGGTVLFAAGLVKVAYGTVVRYWS